jgi:hypothetical protein
MQHLKTFLQKNYAVEVSKSSYKYCKILPSDSNLCNCKTTRHHHPTLMLQMDTRRGSASFPIQQSSCKHPTHSILGSTHWHCMWTEPSKNINHAKKQRPLPQYLSSNANHSAFLLSHSLCISIISFQSDF